jgi:hypothetical protein
MGNFRPPSRRRQPRTCALAMRGHHDRQICLHLCYDIIRFRFTKQLMATAAQASLYLGVARGVPSNIDDPFHIALRNEEFNHAGMVHLGRRN